MKKIEKDIVDVHCHIMYDVDDGSKNLDMSKGMIDIAYEEGIRGIILTPHYNKRFWTVSKDKYIETYRQIEAVVADMYPDMKIYMGCEIFYGEDTFDELEKGLIPTMAEGKYVLVEFMTTTSYKVIKKAIMGIQQRDYIPIIAHVERYDCLVEDIELVEELVELGAYIQVNASTIDGTHGKSGKKMAKNLLKRQLVHFVGTDAHRDDMRTPRIKDAYRYVQKKFGEELADRIFVENPQYIINNTYIEE